MLFCEIIRKNGCVMHFENEKLLLSHEKEKLD